MRYSVRVEADVVESILGLRKVERDLGLTPELLDVMDYLKRRIGPTVKPAVAARLLDVSQPALKRWTASGDLPMVMTPSGRYEVPLAALLPLVEEVRELRRQGYPRPLKEAFHQRREQAERIRPALQQRIKRFTQGPTDGHRRAELRSLALHSLVADRLDERVVLRARRRLDEFERAGKIDKRYADEWREVLNSKPENIRRVLVSDTQEARDLRQNTPMPLVVTEPERRIVRDLVS